MVYEIVLRPLCTPGFHHNLQRFPSQDGRPETWTGEGFASNSRGGQGARRKEGPWSTEHSSLRFSGLRGPSCSEELKPSEAHVTGCCATFAYTLPSPLPETSMAIQTTWLDGSDALSVLSYCPSSLLPVFQDHSSKCNPSSTQKSSGYLKVGLPRRPATAFCFLQRLSHLILTALLWDMLLLSFPFYRRGNRLAQRK